MQSNFKYAFDVLSGLDVKKIDKCMGDEDADSENSVLKQEQDAQVPISYE